MNAMANVESALNIIGGIRRGKNVTQEELWQACDLLDAALRAQLPSQGGEVVAVSIEAAYAMGAKGGASNEVERIAFESWMAGHCWALCATWDGKGYKCESEQGGQFNPAAAMTRRLWAAWRDRAALAATHPANQVAEPDAELVELLRDANRYRLYRQGFEDPEEFDKGVDAALSAKNEGGKA